MHTMQKTLITLMLLVFTAAFATAPMAGNQTPKKFVGTYFTEGGDSDQMVTLHSDGTQTTVRAVMFGASGRVTPGMGVWRKLDKNRVVITNVRFQTSADGSTYEPGGFASKTTFIGVFDDAVKGKSPGFNVVDGFLIEIFTPDQNPITDEPVAAFTVPGGYRASRLEAGHPGT